MKPELELPNLRDIGVDLRESDSQHQAHVTGLSRSTHFDLVA